LSIMDEERGHHIFGKEFSIYEKAKAETTQEASIDDLLLQEIYSLREKLKIAVAAIKSYDPTFDDAEFTHRLGAVDYEQLMEELNGSDVQEPSEKPQAEESEELNAEARRLADDLEAAGMAEIDFEWTEQRKAVYAKRRAKELAAWLPIIRRYLASRPASAAEKALREAAQLALDLIAQASKDAGEEGVSTGCPFECHGDDCESCLPTRAWRALRDALATPETKETSHA
jgi:hypothetical protein